VVAHTRSRIPAQVAEEGYSAPSDVPLRPAAALRTRRPVQSVTETSRARASLETHEINAEIAGWLDAVLETSSEALLFLTPGHCIEKASRAAIVQMGRSRAAILGTRLPAFLPPDDAKKITAWLSAATPAQDFSAVVAGVPSRLILRRRLVQGTLLLALEPDQPPLADGVRADLPLDAAFGPGVLQPQTLQTEKMAALGQLVSGIAHELNNPLTAIMGYAQLLLGRGLRPVQHSEARKIFREVGRARRIVKNLLFFAREAKPERTQASLNEIVERTLALRSYELKVENIVVKRNLDSHLPLTLADPYQLQQVVLNLLVNAEQAILSSRGHGCIWIRTRRYPGHRIRLEVSDNGPGVPSEISSRIFDPFFTTKPPGVGTGLGLSIIYGIVREHEGDVSWENRPRGGTRFIVDLPVVEAVLSGAGPKTSASIQPSRAGSGRRILVVEDEPIVAQLIADTLAEHTYTVDIVLNGREGLSRLAQRPYDLVICDLRMPGLDGPSLFDSLVKAGSPMKDRILFITGDTLARRSMDFLEKHRLSFLAKPFLVEELLLAVSKGLAAAPAAASSDPAPARPAARHATRLSLSSHADPESDAAPRFASGLPAGAHFVPPDGDPL